MKLSEILNELQGSSRRATLVISAFDLINTMDKVEQMGIPVERYDGPTPDGKTYIEYTVYPEGKDEENLDQAFTVYDYKFGEDPTDEENYQKEYPFSVGARARVGIVNASNLGLNIQSMNEENEIEIDKDQMAKLHNTGALKLGKNKLIFKMKEQAMDVMKILKKDRGATPDMIKDFIKTHFNDIKGMDADEIKDEFDNFVSVNYDTLDEGVEWFKKIAGVK
tara:strand:- start:354 stop:1019 length:666 start_codon:yes stop_codon:yes gene_type:complete